jgi:hypothetical protein
MSAGIGLYEPCMITLALLGMHPIAEFPIMMGACALLQPVGGAALAGDRGDRVRGLRYAALRHTQNLAERSRGDR